MVSRNKKRASAMERRVVKKLRGNRVPMSGSGSLKGDGMVYRSFGLMLIECKMSSQLDNQQGPQLRLNYAWFDKLDQDVASMKARFGVVVLHFHGDVTDYVALRRTTYEKFFGPAPQPDIAWTNTRTSYKIYKKFIKDLPYSGILQITCIIGDILIMGIDYFAELLDERYAEVPGHTG
jgi:hypothetical protein